MAVYHNAQYNDPKMLEYLKVIALIKDLRNATNKIDEELTGTVLDRRKMQLALELFSVIRVLARHNPKP